MMPTYEEMIAIRDELNRCESYPDKLALWDEKGLSSFNAAIVIKHPTREVKGAAGAIMGHLKESNSEQEIVKVVSGATEDFWPFFNWCLLKTNRRYSAFTEEQYWQQIERDNFPDEYLNESLRTLEKATQLPEISFGRLREVSDFISTEDFGKYCYRLGIEDFKRGRDLNPETINFYFFYLSFHCLRLVGEAFWGYYDGRHTAEMLKFLREQKRRLDRGEDITRPEAPPAPHTGGNKQEIPAELFTLNYGDRNDKVIRTLYDGLNGKLINTTFEQWERLFVDNGQPLQAIQWLGTETQITLLFEELDWDKARKHVLVSEHFINKKGARYKPGQLNSALNKLPRDNRLAKVVTPVLRQVGGLVGTNHHPTN